MAAAAAMHKSSTAAGRRRRGGGGGTAAVEQDELWSSGHDFPTYFSAVVAADTSSLLPPPPTPTPTPTCLARSVGSVAPPTTHCRQLTPARVRPSCVSSLKTSDFNLNGSGESA